MSRKLIKFTFKIARKIKNQVYLHGDIAYAIAEAAIMVDTYNPMAKKRLLKMHRHHLTMAKFYQWLLDY